MVRAVNCWNGKGEFESGTYQLDYDLPPDYYTELRREG